MVKMSGKSVQELEDLVARSTARRLDIEQGKFRPGVSPNINPDLPPEWFEPEAFQLAQKLFHTYETIIRVSQLIGLNLVLYHTEGLVPLLVTGNSRTIAKLFTRYLSTIVRVGHWFQGDPFDPQSSAYRSVQLVRGMHRRVAARMNAAEGREEDGKTFLWINQYGMCHAQFSFVGLMAIFPKQFGFHNFESRDFHAMFHFWRVIAYCLGTEDRFNLCSGSDEETFELCRRIYYDDWLPLICSDTGDSAGAAMSRGIGTAMRRVSPSVDYTALMHYASPFLGLNPKNYPLKKLSNYFNYYYIASFYKFSTRFKCLNLLSSSVIRLFIRRAVQRRDEKQRYLEERFPELTFDNDRCPFDVNLNYVAAFDQPKEAEE